MTQVQVKEERREKSRCPRCGMEFSYIEERDINGKTYYYAVHYIKVGGKRKKKRCYLGAQVYEYVNKLHSDMLTVHGLLTRNPIEYLRQILDYIVNQPDEGLKHVALDTIKQYLNYLERGD